MLCGNKQLINTVTKKKTVSRRLLTAQARVRSDVAPCEISSGQSDTGTGGFLRTWVGNIPESHALPKIGKRWIQQYGHFLQCGRSARLGSARLGQYISQRAIFMKLLVVCHICVWYH